MGYDFEWQGEIEIGTRLPSPFIQGFNDHLLDFLVPGDTLPLDDEGRRMTAMGFSLNMQGAACVLSVSILSGRSPDEQARWLAWLITFTKAAFLTKTFAFNGDIYWESDDSDDVGVIRVRDGVCSIVRGHVFYDDDPSFIAHARLRKALVALVERHDDEPPMLTAQEWKEARDALKETSERIKDTRD